MTLWTLEAMKARLVRYADLVPCRTAFIDTRTPGSTEKENFTIIGPGVSESPDQYVHIAEKHGFNIGGARQPFGCINSQHSHETAEVFVIHSGCWQLLFGPNCEDGTLDIGPGDVVSVPTRMFRGFKKIDEGKGFIFTVLGKDDPGKVTWAPAVLEVAADFGLKLAKGGMLIDTSSGDYKLTEIELETALDDRSVSELQTPPLDKIRECWVAAGSARDNPASPLTAEGVQEAAIIVPQQTDDGFSPGPITGWWPHGFNLRLLTLETGSYIPLHQRAEEEVLFVQEGVVELSWPDGSLLLGPGDTFSVPVGLPRGFRNTASVPARIFVVRGSENPARPIFT